jgi:hypothetical protein
VVALRLEVSLLKLNDPPMSQIVKNIPLKKAEHKLRSASPLLLTRRKDRNLEIISSASSILTYSDCAVAPWLHSRISNVPGFYCQLRPWQLLTKKKIYARSQAICTFKSSRRLEDPLDRTGIVRSGRACGTFVVAKHQESYGSEHGEQGNFEFGQKSLYG